MCFVLEEENALFTGDNVLGHGFSVVMDLAVYMRSLDSMVAQGCASGYPAHGAKIVNLPAKMQEYIHHNEFRIQQVRSALSWHCAKGAKGGMTLQEIIQSIYGNVPKEIVDNAIRKAKEKKEKEKSHRDAHIGAWFQKVRQEVCLSDLSCRSSWPAVDNLDK